MMVNMIDLFSLVIGGIVGIILGICGFYLTHREYINKITEDIATALKDGKIEFKEFLYLLLDAYAWKTQKKFMDICNEVKTWLDEWVKQ